MSDIFLDGIFALAASVSLFIIGVCSILHANEEYMMDFVTEDDHLFWLSKIIYILAHVLILALLFIMLFEDNIVASGNAILLFVCVIVCGILFFLPLFFRYSVSHFILHLGFGVSFGVCAFLAQADILLSVVMGFCAVIAAFSGSFMHKIPHWLTGGVVGMGAFWSIIGVIAVLIFSLFR